MMNMTPVVKQLLIINIIFFAGSSLVGDAAYEFLSLYFPENPLFQVWQPLTHMFMHGGIMHIFFNMFALFSFGSALEQMWGSKKFLFFYISCGLGAALLHTGVNYYEYHQGYNLLLNHGLSETEIATILRENRDPLGKLEGVDIGAVQRFLGSYLTPAVGASGAIYGLLVAFAYMMPNAELMMMFIPIPIKAKYFVPGLLLIDLYLGITGKSIFGGAGGIAHFAHIGGALIGFIMMWFWKKNQFSKNRWD
jgi:membrane associated rhomboid family serine protease